MIFHPCTCAPPDYLWEKISDFYLLGLVSENTTAASAVACQQQCLRATLCRSINYYPNTSLCNLNSKAWGDDLTAMDFVQNYTFVDYYYYCNRTKSMARRHDSEIPVSDSTQTHCIAGKLTRAISFNRDIAE